MEQMGLKKQGKQISRLIGYTNDGANSVPCRRNNGSRDSKFLDRSIFGIYIHGFCTGGSCLSQLLAFWENLLEAKEEGMDQICQGRFPCGLQGKIGCSQQFAYAALAQFLLASSYNGNLLQPTHKRFNSAYLQNYGAPRQARQAKKKSSY